MTGFLIGLGLGLVVGMLVGVLVTAALVAGRREPPVPEPGAPARGRRHSRASSPRRFERDN